MAYTKLLCCFSLYCLSFGSHSKHHNQCNIHLKSESITGQLALKLVIMTNYFGSSWTFVFVLRMKEFANAILEHYWQTVLTKTVCALRIGLRGSGQPPHSTLGDFLKHIIVTLWE